MAACAEFYRLITNLCNSIAIFGYLFRNAIMSNLLSVSCYWFQNYF